VPGREWNKKEHFFLLQEKIGMKHLLIFTAGKSGTKRNVSFRSGKVEQKVKHTLVFI
jgi:hypothetical protein